MTLWQSVILGVVQGLTEFLPVSSTAHLKIAEALLRIPRGDPFLTSFDVVIQLGTWVSVLIYFRTELGRMITGALQGLRTGRPFENEHARLLWYVLVGSLPVGLLGLGFEKQVARLDLNERMLLSVIGLSLISLALVLFAADLWGRQRHSLRDLSWSDALWIGLAQALAIVPGVSRSGITLTAGLLRDQRRDDAARFSFLLSIPAVGAAGLWKLLKLLRHGEMSLGDGAVTNLVVGTAVAGLVGYAVIAWLLSYLRTRRTTPFVIWRLLVGAFLLAR